MNRADLERKKKLSTELGKFILDITKLVFAGVILTSIIDLTVEKIYLFIFGLTSVILGLIFGFIFINYGLTKSKR